MLRRSTAAALLALAAACGGSDDAAGRTIIVAGEQVEVASFVDAQATLCEAAARPEPGRTRFFERSHDALHTVARALEDVDRAQAAQLLEVKAKVETSLPAASDTLGDDLSRLADVYRASLGRLAITVPPCDK